MLNLPSAVAIMSTSTRNARFPMISRRRAAVVLAAAALPVLALITPAEATAVELPWWTQEWGYGADCTAVDDSPEAGQTTLTDSTTPLSEFDFDEPSITVSTTATKSTGAVGFFSTCAGVDSAKVVLTNQLTKKTRVLSLDGLTLDAYDAADLGGWVDEAAFTMTWTGADRGVWKVSSITVFRYFDTCVYDAEHNEVDGKCEPGSKLTLPTTGADSQTVVAKTKAAVKVAPKAKRGAKVAVSATLTVAGKGSFAALQGETVQLQVLKPGTKKWVNLGKAAKSNAKGVVTGTLSASAKGTYQLRAVFAGSKVSSTTKATSAVAKVKVG